MPDSIEESLLSAARLAQSNAYAKYSNYPVGASILADNGKIYVGANVENSSYPEGQCAETSAIGAMITGGGKKILKILIIANGPVLCTPCGGCRQRIREFADVDTVVLSAGPEGLRHTFQFADLLPAAFGDFTAPSDTKDY